MIWHTQGSGKSLTMAFCSGQIVQHPKMKNPALVVLTDRNDLDDQLFGTFALCHELLRQEPVQAQDRPHLRELLSVASGGVILTTLQKFAPEPVRAVFIFFDPLRGWRRVASCESRTRVNWAEQVRRLLTKDYPKAKRVTLVCDNLNTHDIASLYTEFDAPTAHALAQRLRIEHTPRNDSRLNMAEIELSVLTRQCIGRRFDHPEQMAQAMKKWQRDRNRLRCPATWRFTTSDARIKLQSLSPEPYI